MTNAAHSTHWRGLRARCLALSSILAILGTVPLYGAEGARPGSADRCSGGDCASRAVRGVTVYRGLVLDYEVIDGLAVHGGDMVLGTAEEAAAAVPSRDPAKREASPGPVRRDLHPIANSLLWPGGRVPYVIHEDIAGEDLEVIHAAIEEWNAKTVLTWFPRTDEQQYALFGPRLNGKCRSGVGRGSPTTIWIEGCGLSATIHDMGHAAGLLHEHQRPDRDRFIQMGPDSLDAWLGASSDYAQWWVSEPVENRGPWLERTYDYRSVMHYWLSSLPDNDFSQTIPPGIIVGGPRLSAGDIDGVARLYGKPPGTFTVSTNPPGLNVVVDGESVSTPAMFDWLPDSVHTLEAPLMQQGRVFGRWSDGGGRKRTVEAGPDSTWFEASFIDKNRGAGGVPRGAGTGASSLETPDGVFALATVTNSGEIVVSPESEDGFYPAGAQVQLTAVPQAGLHFLGWEYDVSGTETTQFVIMDRNRFASAKFTPEEPILVQFGEPLQVDSLNGRHYVRVPDGASQVAVRFESSAPLRDAEFYVAIRSRRRFITLGSTRLRESDTITITRDALSRMRVNAGLLPRWLGHHLRIQQRGGVGSGTLHVSIQRDWIAHVWPRAFTLVSQVGWSRPVRQPMRIAPVEGVLPQVRYRIVSDRHWLEAVPPEWTSADGEVEIAVTANGAALAAEAYSGKLKILTVRDGDPPTGGTPTGIEIPVHFVVMPTDGNEEPPGDESSGLAGGDDHGDTRAAATEIAAGASAQGRLERVGDEDWFRFRTTAARTWVTAYTVSEGDTVGELRAAAGAVVTDDDSGSGGNFRIAASVPAGTHYLRVSGFGTPDYTLRLEAVPDDHGHTRAAATEVAAGSAARGRLQAVGDEDWFRFRTTAARTWVTAYTVSEGDTVGELHVAGGAVVTDDNSGSGGNFRIAANVPAGTHYLQVRGFGTTDYTLELEAGFPMEFVRIPAGSFVMGSPEDEEGRGSDERQHEVRISKGFWMGKYEVTQGEWEVLMGANPSWFTWCGSRCPVESVSWEDIQEFLRRLNEQESGSGYVYRLPTEAEWEYAARAGTTGARHGELDEIAWYEGNSGWTMHPVGQKLANAWGLHDMLGSVVEWTADWYGEYPSGAVTDPQGPETSWGRVYRGGSWGNRAGNVRSANRGGNTPGSSNSNFGFRLVRTE